MENVTLEDILQRHFNLKGNLYLKKPEVETAAGVISMRHRRNIDILRRWGLMHTPGSLIACSIYQSTFQCI